MPIKQTIPTNSSDSVQFGNATTPVAAQVTGAEVSTGNGYLAISTTASGTVTERVRVDSAGNVGIGTSSPQNTLHVNSASASTYIRVTNTTGDRTFVGAENGLSTFYSQTSSGTANPMAFNTGGTERMRIDSSGNVIIGKTSVIAAGSNILQIENGDGAGQIILNNTRSSGNQYMEQFYRLGSLVGSIQTSTTATTYVTSSDYRLKENVQPMVGALDTVAKLKPVTYDWISDKSKGQGFIAHELQEVVPDCVTGIKDDVDDEGNPKYQGIDTSFLVATLTAAIQELSAKVTALEAQLGAK